MQQLIFHRNHHHSSSGADDHHHQHDRLVGGGGAANSMVRPVQGARSRCTTREKSIATDLREENPINLHNEPRLNIIHIDRDHKPNCSPNCSTAPATTTIINYNKQLQSQSIYNRSKYNDINKRLPKQSPTTISSFIVHISTISLLVLLVASQSTNNGGSQFDEHTRYPTDRDTNYHEAAAAANQHEIDQLNHQTRQRQSLHNEPGAATSGTNNVPPLCNDCLAIPLIAIMGNGKQVNGFIIQSSQKQKQRQQQQQTYEPQHQPQTRQHQAYNQHRSRQPSGSYSDSYARSYAHVEPPKLAPKSDEKCPMNGTLTVCDQIDSYPAEVILHKLEVAKKRLGHASFNIDSLFSDERDNSGEPFEDPMPKQPQPKQHHTPPRRVVKTESEPQYSQSYYRNYQHEPSSANSDHYNHGYSYQQRQGVNLTNWNSNAQVEQRSTTFSTYGREQSDIGYQQPHKGPFDHERVTPTEGANESYGNDRVITVRNTEGVGDSARISTSRFNHQNEDRPIGKFRARNLAPPSTGETLSSYLSQQPPGQADDFLKIVEGKGIVVSRHSTVGPVSLQQKSKLINVKTAQEGEQRYADDNPTGQRSLSSDHLEERTQVNLNPNDDPLALAASAVKQEPALLISNNSHTVTRRMVGDGGRVSGPIYQAGSSAVRLAHDVGGNDNNDSGDSPLGTSSNNGVSRLGLASSSSGKNSTGRLKGPSCLVHTIDSPFDPQAERLNSNELRNSSACSPQLPPTPSTSEPLPGAAKPSSTHIKKLGQLDGFDGTTDRLKNTSARFVGVRRRHFRRQVANGGVDVSRGGSADEETEPESVRGGGGPSSTSSTGPTEPADNQVQPEPVCRAKSIYISPKAALNDKKQWKYVVNALERNPRVRQIIRVDICENPFGPCSDQVSLPFGFTSQCKQKYAKKKLLALDAQSGLLEVDTFFIPSCCVCQLIPDSAPNLSFDNPEPAATTTGLSPQEGDVTTIAPSQEDTMA